MRKLNVRFKDEEFEALQREAELLGISLNLFVVQAVRNYIPHARRHRKGWEGPQLVEKQALPAARALSAAADRAQGSDGEPIRRVVKVGRNDPCPCGSGRKAKACHPENC